MWRKIPTTPKNQNAREAMTTPTTYRIVSRLNPRSFNEIVHRIYRTGSDLKVQDLPSSHFYLLRENAVVIDAWIRFRGELWDFIPIFRNGEVVGIVSSFARHPFLVTSTLIPRPLIPSFMAASLGLLYRLNLIL